MRRNTEEKNETEAESLQRDIWFTYAVLLKSLKTHFVLKARNTFPKNIKLQHDPDYERLSAGLTRKYSW